MDPGGKIYTTDEFRCWKVENLDDERSDENKNEGGGECQTTRPADNSDRDKSARKRNRNYSAILATLQITSYVHSRNSS